MTREEANKNQQVMNYANWFFISALCLWMLLVIKASREQDPNEFARAGSVLVAVAFIAFSIMQHALSNVREFAAGEIVEARSNLLLEADQQLFRSQADAVQMLGTLAEALGPLDGTPAPQISPPDDRTQDEVDRTVALFTKYEKDMVGYQAKLASFSRYVLFLEITSVVAGTIQWGYGDCVSSYIWKLETNPCSS